ncbi:unnamed protein product [Adineta ricciae]|uniref:Uncharacterized protein n=1 Tax=Adineta ricciae TaxID=249248 RepID=A0A813T9E2_ADIRI|nr:unnamed protein product [Adineta ricciae]
MNYIQRSFHPTTVRENVSLPSQTVKASSSSSSLHNGVRFNDLIPTTQTCDDREKYLTAKYPQQQMQLIRKRLKIEFWLDDELRMLYNIKDDSDEDHNHCPGDLIDSLLDIDDEFERREFLVEKLRNVKQTRSLLMDFIDELLHRVKML